MSAADNFAEQIFALAKANLPQTIEGKAGKGNKGGGGYPVSALSGNRPICERANATPDIGLTSDCS